MFHSSQTITVQGRLIDKGKSFCTTLYDDFFSILDNYRNNNEGKYPTQREFASLCRISKRTAQKIIDVKKKKRTLHVRKNNGTKGEINHGSRTFSFSDQMFLLSLYFENPQYNLVQYQQMLQIYSGTVASRATISRWFNKSLPFKASIRKTSLFPHRKYTIENIERLKRYTSFISQVHSSKLVFTDEKPVRGAEIYNATTRRCPLTGKVPFIKTKFKLRNRYNLMAAIRLCEPQDKCCFYKMGTFQGNSITFLTFVLEMVRTGFLKSGDILVLDNAKIHSADYCEFLAPTLLAVANVMIVFLPAYSPELNPIELCFNYFSQTLKHTDIRSVENHSDMEFLYICSLVLNRIKGNDITKMFRKAGIHC